MEDLDHLARQAGHGYHKGDKQSCLGPHSDGRGMDSDVDAKILMSRWCGQTTTHLRMIPVLTFSHSVSKMVSTTT